MPQPHVVKRGSQFYFRIAVRLSLTKLVGKREIKFSLRTSDALSAKIWGRVLSDGLELLFREIRSIAEVSTGVVLDRAKSYFGEQLSKSLEQAFLLPTGPLCDIDFEIVGTERLATEMRDALKKQHFSPSVRSAQRLLRGLPGLPQSRCKRPKAHNPWALMGQCVRNPYATIRATMLAKISRARRDFEIIGPVELRAADGAD